MGHTLILNEQTEEMYLRRWDQPSYRRFRFPQHPGGAAKLLDMVESASPFGSPDVILYVLKAFRRLRAILPSRDALDSVNVFNTLLVGTESVRLGLIAEDEWLGCRNIGDMFRALQRDEVGDIGVGELPGEVLNTDIHELASSFMQPEPTTGSRLEPDLLLRHAAGQLYQEAHLIIEKDQLYLPGLNGGEDWHGTLKRDVRFTPIALARALVQQALRAGGECLCDRKHLVILDPACGSGVFLQEALRELQARGFRGKMTMRGYDISALSCAIARFCLGRAKREARGSGIEINLDVRQVDALEEAWEPADVILMNPPFVPWQRMDREEHASVLQVMGSLGKGRADKAMAFIWKGALSTKPGGVLSSVMPAPLLESSTGKDWRDALARDSRLYLVGRFQGYSFFRGSLVEPAFVVLVKPEGGEREPGLVKVLLAEERAEDAAIRGLRLFDDYPVVSSHDRWEVFQMPTDSISSASWLPRTRHHFETVRRLSAQGAPTVGDIFDVNQGALTGKNKAFLLSDRQFQTLPPDEQRFFREVADIHNGCLGVGGYIFYPYDETGLVLATEAELRLRVPTYYSQRLRSHRETLRARPRINKGQWWALAEERSWQLHAIPKLITKYFGQSGSFAYDETGRSIVVQGYGWLWRTGGPDNPLFSDSSLPWAYLALLNSPVFESLLAYYCPQVRGGQYNLSVRFVSNIPLPNLADDLAVSNDIVRELAWLGRQIHTGEMPPAGLLAKAAYRAYGVPSPDTGDWDVA